ncbi:MAG TPA: MoaD/ThiS family protein [Prosthecobacter sp.]
MPVVQFTANLARQTSAPSCEVAGTTVREALGAVFARHPQLQSYVLDDQKAVRKHVVVFVDGTAITDRTHLSDSVAEQSEIFVMQALSGG